MLAQVALGAACGSGTRERSARAPHSATDASESPQRRETRELVVQVERLPAHLNPLLASADVWCQRIALHNLVEPLVRRTGAGRFVPQLAERVDVLDGGRRYRFTLRSGVRFHDGRPLTAADVRFTLEKVTGRHPPSELLKLELGDVREVRERDERTVELELARPNLLLPAVLAEVGILPAHVYNRLGIHGGRLGRQPVGTGPFRLKSWSDRENLVLERNAAYWGRPASVATVVFHAISEPARALAALRNGEVDLLPQLYPGYYPEQVDPARLQQRFRVYRIHPYRPRVLLYNTRHPALKDRRVRLALSHLLNPAQIVRMARNDLGQVVSAPLWPLSAWYDASIHAHATDRAAAARLLDSAGWGGAAGAVRRRKGAPLRLRLLLAKDSPLREVAMRLRGELRAEGLELTVEVADFGYLTAMLKRGRFDLALAGLALRPEADLSFLLHSKGALNYGGYASTAVDGLLDALRAAPLEADRVRLARRLHRALHEDPPMTVLFSPVEVMLASRRVKGIAGDGHWPLLTELALEETAR
ncbi:MAG: hypothetical protein IT371_17610 [Deltaproteobacteria bacterium]|nr:hypothetical protein [Deltaproteobacteria bacterium]